MRYVGIFAIAPLLLGAGHYLVWAKLVRDTAVAPAWARASKLGIVALYGLLLAAFFSVRLLPRSASAPLAWLGFTWLGVLFFLVVSLGVTSVLQLVALRSSRGEGPVDPERRQAFARIFGGIAAATGLGMAGAGVVSVISDVAVSRVRVVLDRFSKARSNYRIVQITDVHVGPTIGRAFVEKVVATINALEPDAVAITGDLVDGSVDDLREHVAPLANIRAKDGVFFVTGNHEYYSGADAWIAHLRELGIRVLRNERVRVGGEHGIDIAGIDDVSSRGSVHGHGADIDTALAGRDPARPVVLLAHQPKAIERAAQLGVDLQLSGHTHGGQLFPWNFLVRLQQPFVAGLHALERAQIYVSRGTGYWGPPMRVGAPAEITEIEIVARA